LASSASKGSYQSDSARLIAPAALAIGSRTRVPPRQPSDARPRRIGQRSAGDERGTGGRWPKSDHDLRSEKRRDLYRRIQNGESRSPTAQMPRNIFITYTAATTRPKAIRRRSSQ